MESLREGKDFIEQIPKDRNATCRLLLWKLKKNAISEILRRSSYPLEEMVSVRNSGAHKSACSYWNTLTVETKRELFEVRISDLISHFQNFKDGLASEILLEAIRFANKKKNWRFWECHCCGPRGKKFLDSKSNLQHAFWTSKKFTELLNDLPLEVDSKFVELLENCVWKPVDIMRDIQKQSSAEEFYEEYSKLTSSGCDENWRLSDDTERAEILESIHAMLLWLLRQGFLTQNHVLRVIEYAMEGLEDLIPASLLCLCFSEDIQLKKVLEFLLELAQYCCDIGGSFEKGSSPSDALNRPSNIIARIVFSNDFSRLLLDKRLLGGEHSNDPDAIADDGCAMATAADFCEDYLLFDSDALIFWLFVGPTIEESLALWKDLRESTKQIAKAICAELQEQLDHAINTCESKSDHFIYEKAFREIERMNFEALKKQKQDAQSCRRKWEEEFVERHGDARLIRIQELILSGEAYMIIKACQRQKELFYLETGKIEARMKQIVEETGCDYRLIMFPLVKSFLQARLDDLADKDAIEKSNAARDALLAEELEAQKNINTGNSYTKQTKEDLRDKKKKKNKKKHNRKAKDFKATSGNEQQEDAEDIQFLVAYDGDHPNSEIGVHLSAEELKRQRDELNKSLEHETFGWKLEEKLEYLRLTENKGKQKFLAEQNKQTSDDISNVHQRLRHSGGDACSKWLTWANSSKLDDLNVELGDPRKFIESPHILRGDSGDGEMSFTNDEKPQQDLWFEVDTSNESLDPPNNLEGTFKHFKGDNWKTRMNKRREDRSLCKVNQGLPHQVNC